jgi:hypothetical protein
MLSDCDKAASIERAYSPYTLFYAHFLGRCPRLIWNAPSALAQCVQVPIAQMSKITGQF